MAKKKSIGDIAVALGISKTTISFIINGKAKERRISDQLVEKVEKYIQENDYKPSTLAKSLSTGKTMIIGLMVEKISDYFFAQMAYHIEELAYQNGYKIIYCSTDNNLEKARELIELFRDRHVDGYIITPPIGMENEVKRLIDDGFPVVLFDRFYKDVESSYVVLNNFAASYEASALLAKKGLTTIAFVQLENEQVQMEERRLGYEQAMKDFGLKKLIVKVPYENDNEQTVDQLKEFLIKHSKIDALYFATNYLAFNGIKALNSIGLKIPEDIAVIAFDDHEVFDFYSPRITAMAQPIDELARQSIRVLLEMLNSSLSDRKIEKVVVSGRLMSRDSV